MCCPAAKYNTTNIPSLLLFSATEQQIVGQSYPRLCSAGTNHLKGHVLHPPHASAVCIPMASTHLGLGIEQNHLHSHSSACCQVQIYFKMVTRGRGKFVLLADSIRGVWEGAQIAAESNTTTQHMAVDEGCRLPLTLTLNPSKLPLPTQYDPGGPSAFIQRANCSLLQ